MSPTTAVRYFSALILTALSLHAAIISLPTDGTMSASNWTTAKFADSEGTASFSTSQAASGGNPGSYWNVSQTYGPRAATPSATIALAHLHNSFTWNPATQGVLNTVSVNFHADVFNHGASNAVALGLVLLQNGTYYTHFISAPSQGPSWTAYSATDINATDFSSGLDNPNFSATGSLLEFGVYTSNGTALGSVSTTTTGIDNVSLALNVTPIPEPASTAILLSLVALGLVATQRRR
jgi:hypothetical protein